ncbi:hypothetical protein FBU31_002004 [Coemansia sp. 'formosensis']|nr:hypothetical protein FBU31_002004 [Coemansia sp. 'formosensis']
MLSALRSLSSLSELSEDRASEVTCKVGSYDEKQSGEEQEEEGLEICAQLDRVNAWRLDSQCAVRRRRPQRQRTSGGGEVQMRLANQDLSSLRRMASLERVAQGLDGLADARMEQRLALSAQRVRELFLVGIAARLGRVDGCTQIVKEEMPCRMQSAEHPRDHMRRFVIASIERINRLNVDAMHTQQRFTPL